MTLKLAFDLPQLYQFESPRLQGSENSIIISTCRLSMNIRVNAVPNRTVVDSVWRFNNVCCSHLHSQIDSKNDSEEDYSTGCWNVSHCQQQSYSGLCSPRQSYSTFIWNDSCVQTFHNYYSIIICTAKYACFGGQSVLHFFTASVPAFCIFKTVVLCVCCKESILWGVTTWALFSKRYYFFINVLNAYNKLFFIIDSKKLCSFHLLICR